MSTDRMSVRSSIVANNAPYFATDDIFYFYPGQIYTGLDILANDRHPLGAVITGGSGFNDDFLRITINADGTTSVDLSTDPGFTLTRAYSFVDGNGVVQRAGITVYTIDGTPGLGQTEAILLNTWADITTKSYSFNALSFIDPNGSSGTTLSDFSARMNGVSIDADLAADGTVSFDPSQFHYIDPVLSRLEITVTATNGQGQSLDNTFQIWVNPDSSIPPGVTTSVAGANGVISGTSGRDSLTAASAGSDILAGGLGGDIFYFADTTGDGNNSDDIILDLDVIGDTISFNQVTALASIVEVHDGLLIITDDGNDTIFINGDDVNALNVDVEGIFVQSSPGVGTSGAGGAVTLNDLILYHGPVGFYNIYSDPFAFF